MDIAILGCGPAGLLAAHAASERGHYVDIFSKPEKSPMGGAQFLHRPIPGITSELPDTILSYAKIGEAHGYSVKVYGSRGQDTSWDHFDGEQPAWSMRKAYECLWDKYSDRIQSVFITPHLVGSYCDQYDLVLSTVPATALCHEQKHERPLHEFHGQPIVLVPTNRLHINDVILYSGRPQDPWYRISRIFGEEWAEFAIHGDMELPGIEGQVEGIKPLYTDCNCHLQRSNFKRIGRFGRWQKKELVSNAYADAISIIQERSEKLLGK